MKVILFLAVTLLCMASNASAQIQIDEMPELLALKAFIKPSCEFYRKPSVLGNKEGSFVFVAKTRKKSLMVLDHFIVLLDNRGRVGGIYTFMDLKGGFENEEEKEFELGNSRRTISGWENEIPVFKKWETLSKEFKSQASRCGDQYQKQIAKARKADLITAKERFALLALVQ